MSITDIYVILKKIGKILKGPLYIYLKGDFFEKQMYANLWNSVTINKNTYKYLLSLLNF